MHGKICFRRNDKNVFLNKKKIATEIQIVSSVGNECLFQKRISSVHWQVCCMKRSQSLAHNQNLFACIVLRNEEHDTLCPC